MVSWRPFTVVYFKNFSFANYLFVSGVMEKSFDFGSLLRNNEKKHKSKPAQFVSVAGGVQKRLQTNIKNRKSTRLTVFDSIRNLPRIESPAPAPISDAKMKMEHRRQQLEKWKTEKEQKKKEQAANKKKPFITGVAKYPLTFVPPPPPKPSTSGRVTRSQTRTATKPKSKPSPVKPTPKGRNTQSFAPKNASFKPPEIKNMIKLPKLAPPSRNKNKQASMITFDPVIPNAVTTAKQSKSRPVLTRQNATEVRPTSRSRSQTETRSTRGKLTKPSPKKQAKKPLQSSSSSDIDTLLGKIQNLSRRSLKPKPLSPKVLAMESTSEDKSSSDSSTDKSRRVSLRQCMYSIRDSQSSSDKCSTDQSSTEEPSVVTMHHKSPRKSLPKNTSPRPLAASSSSDRISSASDVEIIEEKSPVLRTTRKSVLASPNNKTPKSESRSEEKLRSPKSPIELSLTPEQMESAKLSPCVTMSRGKDNARREMMWKIDEGLLDEDVSNIDSVDHFRKQLSSEIKRMTEMCETWDKIQEQTVLPEPVQELVLSAIGQSRLLMSKKLQQFASLVERCARPEPGTAIVTPADLQGFWDMVFMQVENVDLRFKKLEELRQRNWVEEVPVPKKRPALAKPLAKKPAKPVGGASRIREMIAAARKAKQNQESQPPSDLTVPSEGEKTFEAGFFNVRSPVRSPARPAPHTPVSKPTLLKAVLSSEAKKASSKSSTPFAMLRASLLAKNVECDGIQPLPQTPQMNPVNLFATPGRSILKSNIDKSGKKSFKAVLFAASDTDLSSPVVLFGTSDSDLASPTSSLLQKQSGYETALDDTQIITTEVEDKENLAQKSPEVKRTRNQRKSMQNVANIENTETSMRTRNQRKSIQNVEDTETEGKTPRRSTRKKKIEEEPKKTPIRSSGRKKLDKSTDNVDDKKSTSKRSTRKIPLEHIEDNIIEKTVPTPQRSSRRNKVLVEG